jgi:hypothetical protein
MGKRKRDAKVAELGPPPFPATEWGDEEEFKAFWGKSLDEVIAECRQETNDGEREIFASGEEFLAALEREAQC